MSFLFFFFFFIFFLSLYLSFFSFPSNLSFSLYSSFFFFVLPSLSHSLSLSLFFLSLFPSRRDGFPQRNQGEDGGVGSTMVVLAMVVRQSASNGDGLISITGGGKSAIIILKTKEVAKIEEKGGFRMTTTCL